MALFFTYASFATIAAYWGAAAMTVLYTVWKLRARQYLVSPYTIVIYTFAFALLIIAPFQYDDRAFQVISSKLIAASYYPYLDLSIGVNAVGFVIFMAALWFIESRKQQRHTPPLVSRPPLIAITTVSTALILGILVFVACLASVRAIPVFGDRTVFNEAASLRPVYNFANYLIFFTTSVLVVWSFITRSRRYVILIAVALLCIFATGGRTSLFAVLELIALMAIYRRFQGQPRKATGLIVGLLAVFGVAGLFLASFRAGGQFQLSGVIDAALYGNTFSDVRDGAYVAQGWDLRMAGESLGGNTYLAGLMSFIPSSLSTFRETWSWGYFTTSSLFGWQDHYGFRGGWSLEMFMNFGFAGVVVAALVAGWLMGRLEAMFYTGVVRDQGSWYPNAYLWSWLGYGLFTVLIASSATYNLYSLVGVVALMLLLSLLRQAMHQRLGIDRRGTIDFEAPMMGYPNHRLIAQRRG